MGLSSWQPSRRPGPADEDLRRQREARRRQAEQDEVANRRGRTDRATATWQECQPAGGTAVAAYLRARGIGLPAAVERGGHLRFHAACPFKGQDGSTLRLPAMVALMTDPITGEPRAIHRTALKAEGSGKSDHPQLGDAKKMLGAAKTLSLSPLLKRSSPRSARTSSTSSSSTPSSPRIV